MPVLNGLDLVEKMISSMVDVSIIILSEYSNFEFVQNILKLRYRTTFLNLLRGSGST